MANERVDVDVILKGLRDFKELEQVLRSSSKNMDDLITKAAALDSRLKRVAAANQRTQQLLSVVSSGRSVAQTGAMLSRGDPALFLRKAELDGRIRDMESSLDQMWARVNNKAAQGLKNVAKGVQNQDLVNLAKTRQTTPSGDLISLGKQIEAQELRLAAAYQRSAISVGEASARKTKAYLAEQSALTNLKTAQAGLVEQERKRNLEVTRGRKVEALLGDGGASLFKIQAGLFANYAVMAQIFNGFRFGSQYVIEFDRELRNFQAIVNTTDTEMRKLGNTFLDVSSKTKFSAVEIAKAAVTMGQAGFSAQQVDQAIESVTLLATASGSDLATSVDVATSAITVFNLTASDMGHVADVITGALNLSKLTMDKLSLGIQYAGNAAAEAGLTLEELVASLGAISNAGIKSGSTIGTGMRQLLVSFQKPTKNLIDELAKVGLTMADVDVKALGLVGVLENLQGAGFGSASAFKALELRGAAAFVALSRNLDVARKLEVQLLLSNAASKANETQMKSLANTYNRLSNVMGEMIVRMMEPFKNALIAIGNAVAFMVNIFNSVPVLPQALGTILVSLTSTLLIRRLAQLSAGLLGFGAAATTAATGATVATTAFGRLWAIIGLTTPWGKFALALAAIVGGIQVFTATTTSAAEELDQLQASLDNTTGRIDDQKNTISSVEQEVTRLLNRYESLQGNSEALQTEVLAMTMRFGEFSDELSNGTITTVDELILALRKAQQEIASIAAESLQLWQTQQMILAKQKALRQADAMESDRQPGFLTNLMVSGNPVSAAIQSMFGEKQPFRQKTPFDAAVDPVPVLRQLGTLDFETASLKEQNNAGRKLGSVLQDYARVMRSINQAVTEAQKAGDLDKADSLIKKQKEIEAEMAPFQELKSMFIERGIKVSEQIEMSVRATNETLNGAIKQLDTFKIRETELKAQERGMKKGSDKSKLISDLKKLNEERDAFIKSVDIAGIAEEAGIDVQTARDIVDTYISDRNASDVSETDGVIDRLKGKVKKVREIFDKITEDLKAGIEQVEREIDRATDQVDRKIFTVSAVIREASDRERGALSGIYSDAEISAMQTQQKDLETQRLEERADAIRKLRPEIEKLANAQERALNSALKSYNNDPNDPQKFQAYIAARKDYNDTIDKQRELTNELADLEADYSARTGERIIQNMELAESIRYVLEEYDRQMRLEADLGLNIQRNITGVLDDAKDSMAEFVKGFVTGTDSMGSSFRKFAVSVIESMLEMAAQAAATKLMSGILGIGMSILGSAGGVTANPGGSGISPNGYVIPGVSFNANNGGMVRAANGIRTRDTVPAILRPGEVVMRNSAVDMLGAENLMAMNAMGNRRIARSGADLMSKAYEPPEPPAPVNVYVVGPQHKPTMTPRDVIVTVTEDMARGGSVAKMVKSIPR